MFRLLAMFAAVSLACGISASAAQASCSVVVITPSVACPESRDNNKMGKTCQTRHTTIICEVSSEDLAKGHLPDSELPTDRLPQSHLPESRLPD